MQTAKSLREFTEALASGAPTPGGGSAAAAAGALGAALVGMIANFTVGRRDYADVDSRVRALLVRSTARQNELLALVDADADAYEAVVATRRAKRAAPDDAAAAQAAAAAIEHAARVPAEIVVAAAEIAELSAEIAAIGNRYLASDAGVAALFADASARSAWLNVRVNLPDIEPRAADELRNKAGEALARSRAACDRALSRVDEIIG